MTLHRQLTITKCCRLSMLFKLTSTYDNRKTLPQTKHLAQKCQQKQPKNKLQRHKKHNPNYKKLQKKTKKTTQQKLTTSAIVETNQHASNWETASEKKKKKKKKWYTR